MQALDADEFDQESIRQMPLLILSPDDRMGKVALDLAIGE